MDVDRLNTAPTRHPTTLPPAPLSPPATVYVLDDDPEMVKALTRLLRAKRFEVRAFPTSRQAIVELVAATLLPIAPLLLTVMPRKELL